MIWMPFEPFEKSISIFEGHSNRCSKTVLATMATRTVGRNRGKSDNGHSDRPIISRTLNLCPSNCQTFDTRVYPSSDICCWLDPVIFLRFRRKVWNHKDILQTLAFKSTFNNSDRVSWRELGPFETSKLSLIDTGELDWIKSQQCCCSTRSEHKHYLHTSDVGLSSFNPFSSFGRRMQTLSDWLRCIDGRNREGESALCTSIPREE